MTLKEIEQSNDDTLNPTDIAPILKSDAHSIRLQAHEDPKMLGFPVTVIGTRVKIPREAFLKHMRGGD